MVRSHETHGRPELGSACWSLGWPARASGPGSLCVRVLMSAVEGEGGANPERQEAMEASGGPIMEGGRVVVDATAGRTMAGV